MVYGSCIWFMYTGVRPYAFSVYRLLIMVLWGYGLGLQVSGFGFRVSGFGLRVSGLRFMAYC